MAVAKFQITRKCKICGETFMAKCQERINAAVGQLNNQNHPLLTVTEDSAFPVGVSQRRMTNSFTM